MGTAPSSTIILILSVVTAGYILACNCYAFRYSTARESGHRLYLTCTTLGFFQTFFSLLLIFLAGALYCFFARLHPSDLTGLLARMEWLVLLISALNIILSVLGAGIYNSLEGVKEKNLLRAWRKEDFSSLLAYAIKEKKLIAVTSSNRKVYIGLVARTNEPQWESSHITLLPLYSGFRREADLKLKISNRYEEVFDYFSSTVDGDISSPYCIEDFYVVIPLSEITASHIFNPSIYNRLEDAPSLPEMSVKV